MFSPNTKHNSDLENTSKIAKYLKIHIDNKLYWDYYGDNLASRISKNILLLRNFVKSAFFISLRIVYSTLLFTAAY